MATTLYLHDATNAQSGVYETPPSITGSNFVPSGNTILRRCDTTIGTAQVSVAATSLAQTANQLGVYRSWVSGKLSGGHTVTDSSCVLNVAFQESNLLMNLVEAWLLVRAYDPADGSAILTLQNVILSASAEEPTVANQEQVVHLSFPSFGTGSLPDGCVLWVELGLTFTQGDAVARTGTLYYDGTTANLTSHAVVSNHASFVELLENYTFAGVGGGGGTGGFKSLLGVGR